MCAQLLWMWQVLLGLTASRRELRRGGGENVASDACTTEVLMQLRVCFFLSFTLSRTLSHSPSLTLFAILLSCCASFNKCTKRMTTSASGAGLPAVTAKNYMPCAKVLPLHYSNIKSSRSSKSTRVAVCNFSLPSPPPSLPLAKCETRLAKNFLDRTCCQSQSAKACQKIIRCILITIQINEIIVIIPTAGAEGAQGASGSTFLHVQNGKTPLERNFCQESAPRGANVAVVPH